MINLNPDNNICPHCDELMAIHEMVKEFALVEGEDPSDTLDTMVKELRMWRATDAYQTKKTSAIKRAIIKKLQDSGYEVDDE